MRRRRSGKSTLATMGIFMLSILIAILAVRVLPIPAAYGRLVFFVLIPVLAFAGVYITNKRR